MLQIDALVMAHYLLRFEGLFLGSSSALNCVARCGRAPTAAIHQHRLTVVTVPHGGGYLSRFWNRDFVEKGLMAAGGFGAPLLWWRGSWPVASLSCVHCYVHKLRARLPPPLCGRRQRAVNGTPADTRRLRRARLLAGVTRLRVERGVHATVGQHDRGASYVLGAIIFASGSLSGISALRIRATAFERSAPTHADPDDDARRSGLVRAWAQNGKH